MVLSCPSSNWLFTYFTEIDVLPTLPESWCGVTLAEDHDFVCQKVHINQYNHTSLSPSQREEIIIVLTTYFVCRVPACGLTCCCLGWSKTDPFSRLWRSAGRARRDRFFSSWPGWDSWVWKYRQLRLLSGSIYSQNSHFWDRHWMYEWY